jgi:hypothetical protein
MVGHNNGGANSAAVRTETVKMCKAVWTEAKVTLRIKVVSTTLGRPEVTAKVGQGGKKWKNTYHPTNHQEVTRLGTSAERHNSYIFIYNLSHAINCHHVIHVTCWPLFLP